MQPKHEAGGRPTHDTSAAGADRHRPAVEPQAHPAPPDALDASALRSAVALGDDEAAARASIDFGRVVRKTPQVVALPQSAEDVRHALTFANRTGCPVAIRGAGHSQAGQSLTDGGLLLDTTGLDRIGEVKDGHVRVQAGTTWRKLVRHVLARGYVPRVLTTHLGVSIGGTLSMGGFGPSSHRHGTQADNVAEIEAVTGDGRTIRCSPTENARLFDSVRCGLGQFAVITEALIPLRRARAHARTFLLAYDHIEGLTQDLEAAVRRGRFDSVAAACVPRGPWLETLVARRSPFARRGYVMSLSVESDGASGVSERVDLLAELRNGRVLRTVDGPAETMLPGVHGPVADRPEERTLAHPWIEAILPWHDAARSVETVLDDLPLGLPPATRALLWAAPADRLRCPLLMRPAGELLLGFGIQPAVRPAHLAGLLPDLEAVGARLTRNGGKRYLSGWVRYSHDQWRAHFGDRWRQVLDCKAAFDPMGVLDSGFIRYRPAPGAAGND